MKQWRCILKFQVLPVLLVTVFALALVSCGGDDTTDPVDPVDPVENDDLTVDSVTGALDAVESGATLFYDTLDAQGAEAAALATKAFLEALDEVDTATIEEDNSLSILCTNGIVISLGGVTWDRVDLKKSVSAAAVDLAAKVGGEATPSSIILAPSTADLNSTDLEAIADELDTCLGGPEDATEIFRDAEVNVAKIQEVLQAGYGVIFWVGHGTIVDGACHLVTGEIFNTEAMAQQAVDNLGWGLLPGAVGPMLSISHTKGTNQWALCVSPVFVQTYGNFDVAEDSGLGGNQVKSIAYISACFSVFGMKDAFLAAGTDVYLGWTWAVSDEWGADFDEKLITEACDQATLLEAQGEAIGEFGRTDPDSYRGRSARTQLWGDGEIMIRAQMRFTRAGTEMRGYTVGVLDASPKSVACYAGDAPAMIQYSLTCNFPDQGTWNCVTTDNVEIVLWDYSIPPKMFIVSKDYQGVSGTIDVTDFGEDKTEGSFSGTLGYWGYALNPEEDPPIETLEITNGTFKYTGAPQ